ncbi:NO-inducible flavohemoprotein [Caldibacillus lycopersici]|uniref:Flavohemoprotein n=1 Tax=Perspicuibacillus lycopersici TaxID=1325689 RepID=A0AAE3IWA4_9BACI|nr:NO-inducible flavohemoprotein [Perspicuibacillus lycopersici]MCU9614571.1 NO-inducible flavohemoprotein [Perspicuibacillus lycopersici]
MYVYKRSSFNMLNTKTIEIIKSTVPVLEKHGKDITTHFYQMMFQNHPELLNIFNHANQRQGRQQTALANAVYAAAAHIDNLEAIIPVVKQIGQKHRALGILPEHYPIVGENLLKAIKDVLGDAATDDIINAWAEAYGVIADAFIGIEKEMYREAKEQPGGWEGFRKFIVDRKVKESDVITSFYLKPEDGNAIASYQAGQYLTVKVKPETDEYTHIRHYSLSDAPGKDYYRISVKREDHGVVSTYLHQEVSEGDVVLVSAPAGDFVLEAKTAPAVLISGGVGLTPMVSMLHTLLEQQPDREVLFVHGALNSQVHALKNEVARIVATHANVKNFVAYSNPTDTDRAAMNFDKEGFIELDWLQKIVATNQADFYFCGPVPFMKMMYRSLIEWGVPAGNIHFEFFGPASALTE